MIAKSKKTLFGLPPISYGLASLGAACLALVTGFFLLVLLGWVLWFLLLLLLLLTTVVAGLLGIGAGIYHKDLPAGATAAMGLILIVVALWNVADALMHF